MASIPEAVLVLASAPRERSNRTLAASGAAAIETVVPFVVLPFGSSPASSNAASCPTVPSSAVRSQYGVLDAIAGTACVGMGASGSAVNRAITAQQLPA